MRLYRRLLRVPIDQPLSDAEILATLDLPDPDTLLRRLFGHLYACGSVVDWSLLHLDQAWFDLIRADLMWLWSQLHHSSCLLRPDEHMAQWEELMVHSPKFWKRLVNRATYHAGLQHRRFWQVEFAHREVYRHLQDAHYNVPDLPVESLASSAFHACMKCRRRFRSHAGQGAHMFRTHGQVARCRWLFDTTSCQACLREYHSYSKLKMHLCHSTSCRMILVSRRLRCTPGPGVGSATDTDLLRHHAGLRPVQQGFGPSAPVPPQNGEDIDDVHYPLLDDLLESLIQHPVLPEVQAVFCDKILATEVSWTGCVATLTKVSADYGPLEEEIAGHSIADVRQMCTQLREVAFWEPYFPEIVDKPAADFYMLDKVFAEIADRPRGLIPTPWQIPRPVSRDRYVLHAFSGRRRLGDVQHFLDSFATKLEGITLCILSVDVIIHSTMGDLASGRTQEFWLHSISQGWVLGLLAGPPCNTWSRARSIEAPSSSSTKRCPRPVRDECNPWGLLSLGVKELQSVLFGNCLMLFVIRAFYALAAANGVGLFEHPDPPASSSHPSIWKVPIVAALSRCPGVHLHRVNQGLFGSESMKPTGILALNLPSFAHDLATWTITKQSWSEQSWGQTEAGHYRSARLKEYPPSLCGAMASALLTSLTALPTDPQLCVPQRFQEIFVKLISQEVGRHIGHDTATYDR
eukprot:Skav227855  [mRNA]  locus=scaffold383:56585:58651:- [translate_table: standard]